MTIRKTLALAALATAWLSAGSAWASGDFGCSTSWSLVKPDLDPCNNQPFLSPGNDSRVNLQLLLLDAGLAKLKQGTPPKDGVTTPAEGSAPSYATEDFIGFFNPPAAAGAPSGSDDYASGEGSRCLSNAEGAGGFKTALDQARGLPADERAALAAARAGLSPNCDDPAKAAAPAPIGPIKSAAGRQFAAYLAGATAFYAGDYDLAHQSFAALKDSGQPWLKETARYMLGRVELNRAQKTAVDQYGSLALDKIDKAAIAASGPAFQAYLHDYPKGDYAISARGLLRRVAWLDGQQQTLAAELASQFAHADADRNVTEVQLVQEADSKLLDGGDPAQIKEPLLLATLDLMRMRKPADSKTPSPPGPDMFEAQRPVFAGHQALFEYLLATHAFYALGDPAAALKHLPAGAPSGPMTYLEFSRKMLRGLALDALKDPSARTLWLQLLPLTQSLQRPSVELALAMNYERAGQPGLVFAAGSQVRDPVLREILLRNDANAALLRQRARAAGGSASEERTALFVLLYKELTRGHYQDFLGDLAITPAAAPAKDDPSASNALAAETRLEWFDWTGSQVSEESVDCPAPREIARTLARDPHQAHGLICLSEFVRANASEGFDLDGTRPADELGGAPSQFPGHGFVRQDLYEQLLADPKTPPNDRAYAMYRAVNCYAPSGNNHCGGKDVDPSQRKQWFRTLKSQYAKTPWGAGLKYYW